MTRRKLTSAERYGVYQAWDGQCFWCREHLDFHGFHIEQVIPLDAVSNPESEKNVRELYELDPEHDFDDFENFVPSHGNCNNRKSFTLYDPVPAYLTYIDQTIKKSDKARKIAVQIKEKPQIAKAIATLERIADEIY